MQKFDNVSPKSKWKPEPAARYNEVNRILSNLGALGEGASPFQSDGNVTVSVTNAGSRRLYIGDAVEIVPDSVPIDSGTGWDGVVLKVRPVTSGTAVDYFLMIDALNVNEIGSALVMGCGIASITGTKSKYALPFPSSPGFFQYASSGLPVIGEIAMKNRRVAILKLGGGGTVASKYAGAWCLSDASIRDSNGKITTPKVSIVDAFYPLNAGGSDCGYMAAETVVPGDGYSEIFLYCWKASRSAFELAIALNDTYPANIADNFGKIKLGACQYDAASGALRIAQSWLGGFIYWKRDYFI